MKPFAFILLLLHVNFSMFISQVDEQDVYEAKGMHVRDIDSLTDWLQDILSKHKSSDSHNNKKDDGDARFFHILKPTHFFSPHFVLAKKPTVTTNENYAPLMNETVLPSGFSTIQSPPPKA
ncbi:hypothetical protein [Flavisolibacter ginsenosidimutans]|uniref:Uncharacterized protein n=1 Tax=Flavisolibacter ginsenosidimutans TaxID=661481 RepID=A0A5B8UKH2_9BACT|nr:hypothetical protein [Flavisolibacter ginsenosidimutans]QEC56902.1 hypothetical protein FSB75_13680 [Flavisolibacter ginsenosidimutans]